MTTKLIELQVDIPDNIQPPPTSEQIVEFIAEILNLSWRIGDIKLPPITEIKVTKTMPSFNPITVCPNNPLVTQVDEPLKEKKLSSTEELPVEM